MAAERPYSLSPACERLLRASVLDEDIGRLKYVSGAREEALRRLGIERVGDLLMHMPRRYLDFTHAYTIEQAPLGEVCTVVATVDRVREKRPRPKLSVVEVSLIDATGVLQIAFFKQPWIAQQLAAGDRLAVMGKVEFSYGFKQMSSPHYEKLDDADAAGSILPVHPVGEGISVAWMRRIVAGALERAEGFCDLLPARLRARRRLMSASRAIRALHFPASMEERERSRQRLAYDELLILQLALRLRNDRNLLGIAPCAHVTAGHVEALLRAFPFEFTPEQKQAVDEILDDMRDGKRIMNRLLLGDVGTGKTAVASVALAAVADTRTQACVMAPTGVLAQQYAVKIGPVLDAAGVSWALLTGATPASERAETTRRLAAGELSVLFGTHAVLSDDVVFRRLTLVVIDEQHRFGVGQRNALRAKGPGADLLVMTATPIPRTLALSVYGDLDTSVIRTRPRAGSGVETKVLSQANRDIAYGALRDCLARGQRAYVICPLVAESDDASELDDVPASREDTEGAARTAPALHSVEREVEHLRHVLPGASIRALHGRLSAAEKDAAIEAFRSGEVQVLVSTTVVEVGVDVPEATVMLIEDGERFGLATLHQLRGRVGRGDIAGHCFIMAGSGSKGARSTAQERLAALERTSDGFALAELDLRLRHEGEILGLRQHGGVFLRFVDLDADASIIEAAHADAQEILRYAHTLEATATLPLRHEVVRRYGDVFREVSGG
ncbi:ATP-dependent DNA helicase RecG [uncultured Enorma sp.]|uniref:ATP-dependent DNA helicase RecG n=1 Tax=uncultured Enorma sp. TaxID=1714346 RepID=UPI0028061E7D|nr:ATP-dependent DNA helicase RecG [uncultured Enorma sp.]